MMALLRSSNVTPLSDKFLGFTFYFIVIFHYKSRKNIIALPLLMQSFLPSPKVVYCINDLVHLTKFNITPDWRAAV